MEYIDDKIVYQDAENLELELALIMLKSPYLEKKLKGINEIKEIAEKIERS